MNEVDLRIATLADLPRIVEVEQAAAAHPWSAGQIEQTLRAQTTRALVATEDGVVVGHLLASSAAGTGELLTLAVLPNRRRRGLGRALLGALRSRWEDEAVEEAFLEVAVDNMPALALYLCHGWTRVGSRPSYYFNGRDAAILKLALPSC